jgi:hypothetical protein
VEGRQDLLVVDIEFFEQQIPLGYKLRVNDFLSQIWADSRFGEKTDKLNVVDTAKKVSVVNRGQPAAQKPPNQNIAEKTPAKKPEDQLPPKDKKDGKSGGENKGDKPKVVEKTADKTVSK